jgi:superfamily II DNA/RNA helicase
VYASVRHFARWAHKTVNPFPLYEVLKRVEHGCIIFSQYFDTAYWVASELSKTLLGEPVAVYAGMGRSGIFRDDAFASVEREEIKKAVKRRSIRLVVATDAACEGLNLQTLGTLINVDLPWNPSRLEQRLGRIRRFGQARRTVDMLNLVYHDTQDERVYQVLSRRLKDKFDIFGGLPDTIEDDWIESVEKLEEMMDEYIHLRQKARNVFELRYKETIDPDKNRWELCSRVLAWWDVVDRLSVAMGPINPHMCAQRGTESGVTVSRERFGLFLHHIIHGQVRQRTHAR